MNTQDDHFHMSDEYEMHSSSQKWIGRKLIETAVSLAKSTLDHPKEIRALDVACGPGNLTIELLETLELHFPGVDIHLTGLDYSETNVKRLIDHSTGRIRGVTASFYKMPAEVKGQNLVISNEGLHWQPPYQMNQISYDYMPEDQKEKYRDWALENLRTVFKNIYDCLLTDSIAVLQFGHQGQLRNLWGLIHDLFNEDVFRMYIPKINFPIYHPSVTEIQWALKKAGFADRLTEIIAYQEDLTEDSPQTITNFFKAVSKPGFSVQMNSELLDSFYKKMEEKLQSTNLAEFRKNQWHRTMISLVKSSRVDANNQ